MRNSSGTYQKTGAGARDARMDNVRGILIMIVVIGHFLLPLERTRFVTGLIYAIYVFHMPCFMILSGYFADILSGVRLSRSSGSILFMSRSSTLRKDSSRDIFP